MTLTKTDIVESVYNQCGFSRTRSDKLIETILETIKGTLESDEDVLLSGFGKFYVNRKDARRGKNSATGNDITLGARRVVTYRCSPVLRAKMNGRG